MEEIYLYQKVQNRMLLGPNGIVAGDIWRPEIPIDADPMEALSP